MLNDVTWRKMPLDILTNETMTYIESQMPDGFEYAPFMFYQACLKKADEDGIFDLEDGLIFARLMRVPSPSIVFMVAGLMAKRKMICHVAKDSNKCFLVDWEYPKGSAPRTMADRRAIVERQIAEQRARSALETDFIIPKTALDNEDFNFNPFDDKKAENVDKTVFDDKKAENVDEKKQTEREKEREIRENRESTHTERESLRGRDSATSAECLDNSAPVAEEKKEALAGDKDSEEIQESKTESGTPILSSDSKEKSKPAKQKTEKKSTGANSGNEVESMLQAFFQANCFGYDIQKGRKTVALIAEKITALETPDYSAPVITQKLLDAFKKMHDSDGVWKDIPLSPAYMNKEGVWAHLLQQVGKTLKKSHQKNRFLEAAAEAQKVHEQQRDEIIEEGIEEYKKYGINPDDPRRVILLLNAKALEKQQIEEGIF